MPQIVCLTLLAIIITTSAIGCGTDSSEPIASDDTAQSTDNSTRTIDSDADLTAEDLVAIGLKSGKQYDIETLPGGVDARHMYWRVDDVAVEYELRFYQSHQDAVQLGTKLAEEGSGQDAILDDDEAEYDEGIRDRRTVFDFRGTPRPKYGAYAIYANIIMLCEGKDDQEAWTRCSALIDALRDP